MVGLGAVVRFAGLDRQSLWFDEAVTAELVRAGPAGALESLKAGESTPPLYYALAWLWARVAGEGEWALRALPALAGTATVPVAWAAARQVTGARGAAAAAALVAVNPFLVWYSQEARAYALLALLGGISLWLCLRARAAPSTGRLTAWGVACALMLATHYFAVFAIAGQAAILAGALRRRPAGAALAFGALAATAAALVPLVRAQGEGERTSWIAGIPLGQRVEDVARELLTAATDLIAVNAGRPGGPWGALGFAAVVGTLALFAWRLDARERGRALPVAAVAAAAIGLPLALALAGWQDYFLDRNLAAAGVPLAVTLGAVAGARRAGGWGVGLVAVACAAGLAVDAAVARREALHRADWRGLSRELGPARTERVLALIPGFAQAPLRVYGQRFGPLPASGARVRELALVGNFVFGVQPVPAPPPAFRLVQRAQRQQVALLRWRAARHVVVTPAQLAAAGFPADGLLLQYGPAAEAWIGRYRAVLEACSRLLAAGARAPGRPGGGAGGGGCASAAAARALTPIPPGVAHGPGLRALALGAARAGERWRRALATGAPAPAVRRLEARFEAALRRGLAPSPADLGAV